MFQSSIDNATWRFQREHLKTVALMNHYVSPVRHMSELMDAVKDHDPALYQKYLRMHEHFVMTLEVHRFRIGPVLLSYAVDNFTIHMGELLRLVFKERPETLKSDAADIRLSLTEVLDATDVRELVIRKRISQIDGRGFRGMLDFLRKLGVSDVLGADEERNIHRVIAERNLITHQGGIVDSEYLRSSGRTDVTLGQQISLDDATIHWELRVIEFTAAKVARALASKFDFDVKPNGRRVPVTVPPPPAALATT